MSAFLESRAATILQACAIEHHGVYECAMVQSGALTALRKCVEDELLIESIKVIPVMQGILYTAKFFEGRVPSTACVHYDFNTKTRFIFCYYEDVGVRA